MFRYKLTDSKVREFKKYMEAPDYYVETWINGNKTHVIDTLKTCRANPDLHYEYLAIMARFEDYDKALCLKVSLLAQQTDN